MATPIRGVLFDKDGTLFDFKATWSAWAKAMLLDLAKGDGARAQRLGGLIGFDVVTAQFEPDSVVIAGTPTEIVGQLAPGVPELTPEALEHRLNAAAARIPQVETVALGPLLTRLRDMGLVLGVATNDAEAPARSHLMAAGQASAFAFVAGYDSGFGGKPDPGMCLGFARAMGLGPAEVVMVGDSTHDLHAGRAAGMRTIAVLTGLAQEPELAPWADAVLPDIGHLPRWIAGESAG